MGYPHFEVAGGSINGANLSFVTSVSYQIGTLAVFLNGQLKRQDFADGWVESSPSTGQFTLNQAPKNGDVVQVFFIDTTASTASEAISSVAGSISDGALVWGALGTVSSFDASIETPSDVFGHTGAIGEVSAGVADTSNLFGSLGANNG